MTTLEIFDPAMCCSSGVCGPSVDPELARFSGDLAWLKAQGVDVRRYNLAQEPGAFAGNAAVAKALQDDGPECLPLVLVDGRIRAMGAYPAREKLIHWASLKPTGEEKAQANAGTRAPQGGCGPQGCC